MTSRAEDVVYLSLTDTDRLERLIDIGLDLESVPTEPMRPVIEWAINQFFESGRTVAPSREAMLETWGKVIDDARVELLPEDEDADSTSWAVENLHSHYVMHQFSAFTKVSAIEMASAAVTDRLATLSAVTDELFNLTSRVQPRHSQRDAFEGTARSIREFEARQSEGHRRRGIGFGLPQVDDHTFNIHPGELAVIAAPPKTGKAQPLDAPVLTPAGWVRMGDIKPGDQVVGSDGRATDVLAIHPQGEIDIWRVTTDDGAVVECCGDHLWRILPHGLSARTVSTRDIAQALADDRKRYTYIPVVDPVEMPEADLPIDPYLLGMLLGDGCVRGGTPTLTPGDPELIEAAIALTPGGTYRRYGESTRETVALSVGVKGRPNPLTVILRDLGVWGELSVDKTIPTQYLRSSVTQRMALLAGLMDTDGGINGRSTCFYTSSPGMRDCVTELVRSLGGVASCVTKTSGARSSYTLSIRLPETLGCPFRFSRKAKAWHSAGTKKRPPTRRIVEARLVRKDQAMCITVAANDHLYVTGGYVVTHNSYLLGRIALEAWMNQGKRVVLFTLENSVEMTFDRIICMHLGINSRDWQRGLCSPEEVQQVREFHESIPDLHGHLEVIQPESDRRTMESMVRQAKMLDADALLIDQLTFVKHPNPGRKGRPEIIGELMHSLKESISTGTQKIPTILAHQINREGAKAAKKTGFLEMEHLAEGSEVERTADWVFGLHQSADQRQVGEALLQILAARREDIKTWEMTWEPSRGLAGIIREKVLDL